MSNISNLYASRIYSEHPIGLWPLDDDVSFLSLLDDNQKHIENWNLANLQYITSGYETPNDIPFPESASAVLSIVSASVTQSGIATGIGDWTYVEDLDWQDWLVTNWSQIGGNYLNLQNIDDSRSSICISLYVYAYSDSTISYDIGFSTSSGELFSSYLSKGLGQWQKLSFTTEIINEEFVSPIFRINYSEGGPISGSEYHVMINGLSIGQWSEPHNSTSTGATTQDLTDPDILSLLGSASANVKYIEADAYGINQNSNGYYLVDENKLLAENIELPMVYGSRSITSLRTPNRSELPCVIVPGAGFLNSSGIYNDLTVEFWLRTYSNMTDAKKIFGPMQGSDGLYIEEEFLTLRVGKYTKSYFISKWYRPMLIDIRYSQENISLLINGETVISIDIDINEITFPEKEYDFLGFYTSENIKMLEIDCIVIYPYIVPNQLAKKRFIYGQGVDTPENITSNYKGESLFIDFPYAKYTSTINYPDMNTWGSGFFSNLNATSKYLTFPEYAKPELIFYQDAGDLDFYSDNYDIQDEDFNYIKLKPNSNYDNINSTIYFDTANPISSPTKSIFGTFISPDILSASSQVLMYFTNKINTNIFKITINEDGISYIYNNTVLETIPISGSATFHAGIDFDLVTNNYYAIVGNFFSNPHSLSLNIGNFENETFEGKIFGITFNNRLFTDKDLNDYIYPSGFFIEEYEEYLIKYIGNYTLSILKSSSSMILDVGVSGYWEDSIPLSYFGKYIQTSSGSKYYDLDLIQFNINYPSSPLVGNNIDYETFDDFTIQTYITLQHISEVGKIPYSQYINVMAKNAGRVLDFDNTLDIIQTKYQVIDGTVIFPPKELVDFKDYYITIHLEAKTTGIESKPMKFNRISLSSLAIDESDFYSIGTRGGSKIYPFSRYETGYSYKDKNPFLIYKDSSSYMYLTSDSGITIVPYAASSAERGFSIPINAQKASEYLLGGIQLWMFYNKGYEFEERTKIARISALDRKIDVYLVPEQQNKRAQVLLYNIETGIEVNDIKIYQNGSLVDSLYLEPVSWNSIVLSFDNSLNLNNYIGQLELYEGFLYNNIGLFQKSTDILGTETNAFTWEEFRTTVYELDDEILTLNENWGNKIDNIWNDFINEVVNITSEIDGKNIYESQFGLSKVVSSDSTKLLINSDSVKIITDVEWSQYSGRAV